MAHQERDFPHLSAFIPHLSATWAQFERDVSALNVLTAFRGVWARRERKESDMWARPDCIWARDERKNTKIALRYSFILPNFPLHAYQFYFKLYSGVTHSDNLIKMVYSRCLEESWKWF